MKFIAWYSIAVGVLMLGQWGFFLAAGQVPELQTEPLRIAFHLLGEGVAAISLIVSGVALLRRTGWARDVAFAALGMLTYTVLVEPRLLCPARAVAPRRDVRRAPRSYPGQLHSSWSSTASIGCR